MMIFIILPKTLINLEVSEDFIFSISFCIYVKLYHTLLFCHSTFCLYDLHEANYHFCHPQMQVLVFTRINSCGDPILILWITTSANLLAMTEEMDSLLRGNDKKNNQSPQTPISYGLVLGKVP